VAVATYKTAYERRPRAAITLRQGARVIEDSRSTRVALRWSTKVAGAGSSLAYLRRAAGSPCQERMHALGLSRADQPASRSLSIPRPARAPSPYGQLKLNTLVCQNLVRISSSNSHGVAWLHGRIQRTVCSMGQGGVVQSPERCHRLTPNPRVLSRLAANSPSPPKDNWGPSRRGDDDD
jgi:hypothetical protein